MDWLTDRGYFVLAVIIYGLSMIYSVFLWRQGFRRDNRVNYLLLLAGFVFHSAAMFLRGFRLDRCPVSNLYEATIFALWSLVAVYLAIGAWRRLRFLGAFASPILFGVGVFALMPKLDTLPLQGAEPHTVWTSIHAAVLSLAYGAFGLCCVAAIMYLSQERKLKFHKLEAILSLMPPIQRLQMVTERLMIAGFALLSVGLAIGAYDLSRLQNPETYRGDPKIVWSAGVWILYLGLLVMRWKFAQGGRKFAIGAIGTFAFVLLTFWVTNVLSPLHHQ